MGLKRGGIIREWDGGGELLSFLISWHRRRRRFRAPNRWSISFMTRSCCFSMRVYASESCKTCVCVCMYMCVCCSCWLFFLSFSSFIYNISFFFFFFFFLTFLSFVGNKLESSEATSSPVFPREVPPSVPDWFQHSEDLRCW